MTEGRAQNGANDQPPSTTQKEEEAIVTAAEEAEVLDEDDDFEDFENEGLFHTPTQRTQHPPCIVHVARNPGQLREPVLFCSCAHF